MHRAWSRNHGVRRFGFAGVHVMWRFHSRASGAVEVGQAKDVHDVIMGRLELRLREEWEQVLVPAVPVRDNHFLAAVARHLVSGGLQQFELKACAVRDRAWLVPSLKYLAEIIFREDHGEFL